MAMSGDPVPTGRMIAIRMGTTNISVGVHHNNRIEVIANDRGNRMTPACVSFTDKSCLIGDDAADEAIRNMENTIPGPRKLIGRSYAELFTGSQRYPFTVLNEQPVPMIQVEFKNETLKFSAEGITGMLMERMKKLAEEFLSKGRKVTSAVITHPAYFTDKQITSLKSAAVKFAGISNVILLPDPIAAVSAYGLDGLNDDVNHVLVFHCGGETTSAAVVRIGKDSSITVTGQAHNLQLGGRDFDDRLFDHCANHFQSLHPEHDLRRDKRASARLFKSLQTAKIRLSNMDHAEIAIDSLHRGLDFHIRICRSEFDEMCSDLFFAATDIIDEAINKSKITKDGITYLIMIGGSCGIPKLCQLVEEVFDYSVPVCKENNMPPDMVVMHGAVLKAALLASNQKDMDESMIVVNEDPVSGPVPVAGTSVSQTTSKLSASAMEVDPVVPQPIITSRNVAASPAAPVPQPSSSSSAGAAKPAPTAAPRLRVVPQPRHHPAAAAASRYSRQEDQQRLKKKNLPPGPPVGIDLGTTNSCIGIWNKETQQVEIIPDGNGNSTLPSVVSFSETGRLFGHAAIDRSEFDPENVVSDVKRLMGRNYDDHVVQSDIQNWQFTVVRDRDGVPLIEVESEGRRKRFLPEQISGFILEKLKDMAEVYTKKQITKAVITVPAYFNDAQINSTKRAAGLAGLQVMKIIREPTAAAIAYGKDYVGDGDRNILVYDLGGGTFDVSILKIDENGFSVLATDGDTHLGGKDFDDLLVNHFIPRFNAEHGIDISNDRRAKRRLQLACEKAKVRLSDDEQAVIEIDRLSGQTDFRDLITRSEFEDLCDELFQQTLRPLPKVLSDAGLDRGDIHDIVLVGGSTRIPAIQRLVQEFFNGKELSMNINPDEAVAHGAVYQSALMAPENEIQVAVMDVTPLTLGVGVAGEAVQKVIPRNTRVPYETSFSLTTMQDNQEFAYLDVLQGERERVRDCVKLGSIIVTGIPPARSGDATVTVVFRLDEDGSLTVKAKPGQNAAYQNIEVQDPRNKSEAEIQQMIDDAEQLRAVDLNEKERMGLRNRLYDTCYDHRNDARIGNRCKQTLEWLFANPDATRQELTEKINQIGL